MAEETTQNQQGPGTAAGAGGQAPGDTTQQAGVQQAQTNPTPGGETGTDATQQQPDSWEARYRGLMQTFTAQSEQLRAQQEQLEQTQAAAQELTTQANQWQQVAQQSQAQLIQTQAQAAEAMREAAYATLVQQEYPDLAPIASALQRLETPDQQRQLLDAVRQQLGQRVAQQTVQQVRQNLAGVTPGAGPGIGAAGPGQPPSYEQVMEHVMDEGLRSRDRAAYDQWMEIYRNHPGMTHASLGTGEFRDPFPNHYRTMAQAQGITPAALGQQTAVQNADVGAGMPGAFGGSQAPNASQGDPWTQAGGSN